MSLTTRTFSGILSGSSAAVMTMVPYRPLKIWSATEPCRWGWYQNVPLGWSVGIAYS